MPIARKAPVWLLFAVGGTVTALVFPVLIAVFLLLAAGFEPPGLEFAAARAAVTDGSVRLILFSGLGLALWHAAHRLRMLAHDLGLRADKLVATSLYAAAGIATLFVAVLLAGFSAA